MNAQQRKYACERVAAIRTSRLDKLRIAFNASARIISDEERASLIRTGKVKLRANVHAITNRDDVSDVFDYSQYAGHTPEQRATYAQDVAAVETQASTVRDQIMLGDAEVALQLLTSFASGTAA